MLDNVIQEIERYFADEGFEETALRGHRNEKVYKYKDGSYYMISRGEEGNYYLEDAETLEDAKNKVFEDMGNYGASLGDAELIAAIKADIMEYIIRKDELATAELFRLLRLRLKPGRVPQEINQALDSVGLYITQNPSVRVQ